MQTQNEQIEMKKSKLEQMLNKTYDWSMRNFTAIASTATFAATTGMMYTLLSGSQDIPAEKNIALVFSAVAALAPTLIAGCYGWAQQKYYSDVNVMKEKQ